MIILYSKLNNKKLIRHFYVSAICGTVEYCTFIYLIRSFDVNIYYSHCFSFFLATCIGFVGHSFFTFKVGSLELRNALFFTVQVLIALLLSVLILRLLLSLGIFAYAAKALQMCTTFIFNFLFGYLISFKNKRCKLSL
jgi:putative flippase GtrA